MHLQYRNRTLYVALPIIEKLSGPTQIVGPKKDCHKLIFPNYSLDFYIKTKFLVLIGKVDCDAALAGVTIVAIILAVSSVP